ncbi:chromatin accessibility complex protein 1 isoform X1 [Heterocephalus glaber]|uniref:Chromatin accessibility complex protein 1 n=1 Tax=Heterocephalus glaber TaxID=10181 RepID=A0AAX6NVN3_HETGA|nr:chromatin accessibility complex protein 1 isoform X1 [Heterocephalus glaber]
MADVAVGKDKCGEQRLVSLPLSRIRVIMKSSPEVSSINQEALVLTAKATELFVQYLATYSYRHGSGKEKKALTYSDLANTAEESETFQFLAVHRSYEACPPKLHTERSALRHMNLFPSDGRINSICASSAE